MSIHVAQKYFKNSDLHCCRRTIHYFGCKAILIEPGSHKTQIINLETIEANILQSWKDAAPETKAEYGEQCVKYSKKAPNIVQCDHIHLCK